MGRVRLVAVAALVAALAAGCGDAPTPKFEPPPSSEPAAPTTTAASDPLPPEMPELAKKHTVAGAKAFVEFVIARINYSQSMLDEAALRPLFSEGCYVCQAAPDTVGKIRSRHGKIAGGVVTASDLSAVTGSAGGVRLIDVTFTWGSTRQVITYPGGRRTIYKAGSVRTRWTLSPRKTGWIVVGWAQP